MLRDRLDSCEYDLDQLLLGTIFFTMLFFLMPTVVVYYVLFVVVWHDSKRLIFVSDISIPAHDRTHRHALA